MLRRKRRTNCENVRDMSVRLALAGGRTILLVEVGVNLVCHVREKGQVLPRKTLGTFPLLSVLVVRVARTFGGQLHISHGSIDEKAATRTPNPL